jgi:hypothetical protein
MSYNAIVTIVSICILVPFLIGIYKEYEKDKKDSEKRHHPDGVN